MIENIFMEILGKPSIIVERIHVFLSPSGKEYAFVEIHPSKNRRTTEILQNNEETYGVIITLNTVYIDRNKEFYKMNKGNI